ncbi:MAG: YciI family protein, partial [Acinetobacter sp.]
QAGFYGSTIIVDFDSREALDTWLQDEPFLKEGVYAHIDVKPFNKAFPQG